MDEISVDRCHYCNRIAELTYESIHVCIECMDKMTAAHIHTLYQTPWGEWIVTADTQADLSNWTPYATGTFREMWELANRKADESGNLENDR